MKAARIQQLLVEEIQDEHTDFNLTAALLKALRSARTLKGGLDAVTDADFDEGEYTIGRAARNRGLAVDGLQDALQAGITLFAQQQADRTQAAQIELLQRLIARCPLSEDGRAQAAALQRRLNAALDAFAPQAGAAEARGLTSAELDALAAPAPRKLPRLVPPEEE